MSMRERTTWLGWNRERLIDVPAAKDRKFVKKVLIPMCAKILKKYGVLKERDWCGVGWHWDKVYFWYEPVYQFEPLHRICITKNKKNSSLERWQAMWPYGSWVRKTIRYYKDYKTKGKFVKLVDELHTELKDHFGKK